MKSDCFPLSFFCFFSPFSLPFGTCRTLAPHQSGAGSRGPADGWARVPAFSLAHSNPESRAGVLQVPRARYATRACLSKMLPASRLRGPVAIGLAEQNTAEPEWLACCLRLRSLHMVFASFTVKLIRWI